MVVNVYKCKSVCEELQITCHNTKNRIIEKMCECEKEKCKVLGDYLQILMVLESLCSYVCICCCEQESLSSPIMKELKSKCNLSIKLADKLLGIMTKEQCEYIRCSDVKKACENCKALDSAKKTKKK